MAEKFYTAREVIEMIDAAKAAHMRFIKIPGFEGTWDVGTPPRTPLTVVATPAPAAPKKNDPLGELSLWRFPIGKSLKGRSLAEVPRGEVEGFCNWLLKSYEEGNALSDAAQETLDKSELYYFGEIRWRKRGA